MNLEPGWHPLVVHFPIALTLCAGVLLASAKAVRSESLAATLATVGTWNLCVGAAASVFALATGLAAVLSLEVGAAAHAAIAAHVKWAIFTSLALLLTAVWRGAGYAQQSRPSGLFLVVLSATCAALGATAFLGAQNVYVHGIGVHESHCAGKSPVK